MGRKLGDSGGSGLAELRDGAGGASARSAPRIDFGAILLRGVEREERIKALLLSMLFFLSVATLWLLKPVRVASLLAHLGARETPYVRLAGVATVALVVMLYSYLVDRFSRLTVARAANLFFGALLVAFWLALRLGGAWLGAQRPFIWAVYILVEIYSVVLIGVFWTYTNDVVSEDESNRLYGVIGIGGIVGGIAGGAFVDSLARSVGTVNLLLVCAGLVVASAALFTYTEHRIRPPQRSIRDEKKEEDKQALGPALEGFREARRSSYLMLIVGIVIAYEFTATLTDFGVSVVFERAFQDETDLAKMYGRLGWIVSATALASQVLLVPLLLPHKRVALMVPPLVMLAGGLGLLLVPTVAAAILLGACDRGLNYSVHQAAKESLYVPLTDAQKYKAKAFIDMFVDRAAKAMAAFVLIAIIQTAGESVYVTLLASFVSMAIWAVAAYRLGAHRGREREREAARSTPSTSASLPSAPRDVSGHAPVAR